MSEAANIVHYHYQPLEDPESETRVLFLQPSNDEAAELICSTTSRKLFCAVDESYEALSYTWGAPTDVDPVPILFNSHYVHISTNLAAALRVLRYHDRPRILWVDALCIDQNNRAEKSIQVAQMGEIYARASSVLIWLGPSSCDSDLAMSTLAGLTSISDFENLDKARWQALEQLCSRKWFSRIWVLQQFTRAQQAVFLCGKSSFSWDTTGNAIRELWLGDGDINVKDMRLLGEAGNLLTMASWREEYYTDEWSKTGDPAEVVDNLVKLLRLYGKHEATHAHDKIYGMLGMISPKLQLDPRYPGIHYDLPIEDVYIEWAEFLMSVQDGLDLLYASRRVPLDSSLPSWCQTGGGPNTSSH